MKGFREGLRAGLRVDRPKKKKKPRQLTASELAAIRAKLRREQAVEALY